MPSGSVVAMTSPHRHFEAGGDPARSPADDLANPPRGPHEGNDFPDVPTANRPGRRRRAVRDQDQPDLDEFAERLGIADTDEDTAAAEQASGRSREGLPARAARGVASGVETVARVLRSSAGALDRLSAALRPDDGGD